MLKLCDAASVAVRNFPLDVVCLRKKLGLKDSNSKFVFGTTVVGDKVTVILCDKVCP